MTRRICLRGDFDVSKCAQLIKRLMGMDTTKGAKVSGEYSTVIEVETTMSTASWDALMWHYRSLLNIAERHDMVLKDPPQGRTRGEEQSFANLYAQERREKGEKRKVVQRAIDTALRKHRDSPQEGGQ